MPETRTVTVYFCINPEWLGVHGLDNIHVFTTDPRNSEYLSEYVAIHKREVSVEIPDKQMLNDLQIDVLERQIERKQAEHHQTITTLKERVQSLRALPFIHEDD